MDEAMRLCIKEAIEGVNNGDGGPFGAAILQDGKIIALEQIGRASCRERV